MLLVQLIIGTDEKNGKGELGRQAAGSQSQPTVMLWGGRGWQIARGKVLPVGVNEKDEVAGGR